MMGFTFSLERLRAAPPEVRRWLENEIGATRASLNWPDPSPPEPHRTELAACTPQEAARMSELIKDNFLLSQVFFELAREMPHPGAPAPFYALNIGEIIRHTRLEDGGSPC